MVVANLFFILESTSIKLTTKKWPENQLSLDLNKNKNEIPIFKKKRVSYSIRVRASRRTQLFICYYIIRSDLEFQNVNNSLISKRLSADFLIPRIRFYCICVLISANSL